MGKKVYHLIPHFNIAKLGYAGVYLFFFQNIDCGYSLELPQWGGSNVYPQSMFRAKIQALSLEFAVSAFRSIKFVHSSLPFVCKSGNFLFYFRTETVSQVPGVLLKSIQHLSLGNDVTSSDKNIVIAWLKHIFVSKFFAQHIQCILRTLMCNRIETKAEFYQFKQLPDRYLHSKRS